jgi:hypothetical protein
MLEISVLTRYNDLMSQPPEHRAALVGDVVASRTHPDQQRLFSRLVADLEWVNDRLPAIQPLQLTVGDEFQGLYQVPEDAVIASVLVRLRLAGSLDIRLGIGWGPAIAHDAIDLPSAQSGQAWWNAREALDFVAATQVSKRKWPATLRSWIVGEDRRTTSWILALLLLQDQILATMDEKDAAIALALFFEERQVDLASEFGISQSTISQRQRERGPSALFRACLVLKPGLDLAGPEKKARKEKQEE